MTAAPRLLEVIVTNAREAVLAQGAGADRVELVAQPDRGGLSPTPRTLAGVLQAASLPVHAMVRPHDRSFCYERPARRTALDTAARFAALGPAALVFGALTLEGDIDVELLKAVIERTAPVQLTFHRAFDEVACPRAVYAALARFPAVTRVLTAGAAADAWHGRALLRELAAAGASPIVLAAGGITQSNVRALLCETGVREIHVGSAVRTQGRLDPWKIGRLSALIKSPGADTSDE